MAYVYRHIRLDTNKVFYIGIGSGSSGKYKRAKDTGRRSLYWKNITSKTEYRIDILFDDIDLDVAKEKEVEFIKLYGRKDKNLGTLVNLTDGGEGAVGVVFSDETRKRMSLAQSGKVLSESTLEKFRAKKTEDAKKNMCKPKSETHRLNIQKARLGKKANLIMCPHCEKVGGDNTMKRWHFENCKLIKLK